MSEPTPNPADLPADVQAFVAAQAAELARKDAQMSGLSLSHATAQKRLKDEMEAALAAERAAHARAILSRDTLIADLRLQRKHQRFCIRSLIRWASFRALGVSRASSSLAMRAW